jgi:hydroxyacylglutathione hydrolase
MWRSVNVVLLLLALTLPVHGQPQPPVSSLERGRLPARWTGDKPDCANAAPFFAHEYTATLVILRQSGCTNYEKPFLYLLFGAKQALLVDTGAPGAEVSTVVDGLLRRHAERQQASVLPLLVVHSHGHGDHVAGDAMLATRPGTTIVDARPEAVAKFFGIRNWPREIAQYDLGDRLLDIVPIPGHEPASIAIYDRRTGVLLTGDTVYPGRLYVRDAPAFGESVNRLVEFTVTRDVAHVLGAHIENTRTPYLDYPIETTHQPDEHVLELGRAHLIELQDALRRMGKQLVRRPLRDFTVWPLTR